MSVLRIAWSGRRTRDTVDGASLPFLSCACRAACGRAARALCGAGRALSFPCGVLVHCDARDAAVGRCSRDRAGVRSARLSMLAMRAGDGAYAALRCGAAAAGSEGGEDRPGHQRSQPLAGQRLETFESGARPVNMGLSPIHFYPLDKKYKSK